MTNISAPKVLYLDTPLDKFADTFKEISNIYISNKWSAPMAYCSNEAGSLITLFMILYKNKSQEFISKYINADTSLLDLIDNNRKLPKLLHRNKKDGEHKGLRLRDKINDIIVESTNIKKEGLITMAELYNTTKALYYICLSEVVKKGEESVEEMRIISNIDPEFANIAVADLVLASIADGHWIKKLTISFGEKQRVFKSNLKNTLPISQIYNKIRKTLGDNVNMNDYMVIIKKAQQLEHNADRVQVDASPIKSYFKTIVL